MILKEDKSRSRSKWEHQSRKVKTRRVIKKKNNDLSSEWGSGSRRVTE